MKNSKKPTKIKNCPLKKMSFGVHWDLLAQWHIISRSYSLKWWSGWACWAFFFSHDGDGDGYYKGGNLLL